MRALALANQKGGVGKTTTAIHLGRCFAMAGQRVALLDLDPQGNATLALQAALSPIGDSGTGDAMEPLVPAGDRLWVLPSVGVERAIEPGESLDVEGLERLRNRLRDQVDVLLVDCPPRMDAWGWAGLRLCDQVLVPVQAEFFAMHGLSCMLDTIERAGRGRAELMGVFISMFDHREEVALEVWSDLRSNLGSSLFDSIVVRDAQFIEAASHGMTLLDYNPLAKGARCYVSLAREVMGFWSACST